MRFLVFNILASILCMISFEGESLALLNPPPGMSTINSPYGPRFVHRNGGIAFEKIHPGVDYQAAAGFAISPVESGTVTQIGKDGANDYFISITGATPGHFSYVHIFNNDYDTKLPLPQGPIFAKGPNGNVIYPPVTLNVTSSSKCHGHVIVFWTDLTMTIANYAISDCSGTTIGGITAKTQVTTSDIIALVGTSGGVAPHLHLGLKEATQAVNPLLYITPPSTSNFSVNPVNPIFPSNQTSTVIDLKSAPFGFLIHVDPITSPYGGFDLNQVILTLTSQGSANPIITTTFDYGGTGNSPQNIVEFLSGPTPDVEPPGVVPLHAGIIPDGIVDFCVPFDFTTLSPGNYTLTIEAKDIYGVDSPKQIPTYTITIGGIAVSPPTAILLQGEAQQFTASMYPSSGAAFTWSASGGSIDPVSGLYTAPSTTGTYSVTATSQTTPPQSGSARVIVTTTGGTGGGGGGPVTYVYRSSGVGCGLFGCNIPLITATFTLSQPLPQNMSLQPLSNLAASGTTLFAYYVGYGVAAYINQFTVACTTLMDPYYYSVQLGEWNGSLAYILLTQLLSPPVCPNMPTPIQFGTDANGNINQWSFSVTGASSSSSTGDAAGTGSALPGKWIMIYKEGGYWF